MMRPLPISEPACAGESAGQTVAWAAAAMRAPNQRLAERRARHNWRSRAHAGKAQLHSPR